MLNEGLRPNPRVIDTLRGVISEPVQTVSQKPGPTRGQLVTVRLALEGPGMFGLTDRQDSEEWFGINNHTWLTMRGADFLAILMIQAGYDINRQQLLDGLAVSHAGRRQWDEAIWYPEATPDSGIKRSISNETLGLRLIQGKVPPKAFDLVAALAHNIEGFSVDPNIYSSPEYKISIYVDHRTTQKHEPLSTRMGDFLLGNFFRREEITPTTREDVYDKIGQMIERQGNYRLGKTGGQEVTLDLADQIAEELGATPDSPRLARKELMRLILQDADTEANLIKLGIDPDDLNDQTIPMPAWEYDLREQYTQPAFH